MCVLYAVCRLYSTHASRPFDLSGGEREKENNREKERERERERVRNKAAKRAFAVGAELQNCWSWWMLSYFRV